MAEIDHWVGPERQGSELEGVRWVYHFGYYDGPLSGMVRLTDGRQGWAEIAAECNCYDESSGKFGCGEGWYRQYQVWLLHPKQFAMEAQRHEDFRRFVGTHTDYGLDEKREVRPQEMWDSFYEKWPLLEDRIPVTEGGIPLGWFSQ